MEPPTENDPDIGVPVGLGGPEVRVLGCLIEKAATVPDSYPMTLNALRTACNQSTSRDPVVDYDEGTVERALDALRAAGVSRIVYSRSNRAPKYRHVADEAYDLSRAELALISVLLLRGPQTVGELKARTERQHAFADTDAVADGLDALARRQPPLVERLERRPGQKDARWIHRLGVVEAAETVGSPVGAGVVPAPSTPAGPVLRVARATADLATIALQYADGLDWEVLAEWEDHDGIDGMVIGAPGGTYHLEFVHVHDDPNPPAPHHEHLLALYVPDLDEWAARADAIVAAGFVPVVNPNPYWETNGRTFADADGGRVVLVRGAWGGS